MNLTVSSMFRNDALYLREWIEFHLLMGVGRFYLYHQGTSTPEDGWREVLHPYVERRIVDVKEWPYRCHHSGGRNAQIDANQDCIDRIKGQKGWLALIDSDEFLFSPRYETVTEALATLPQTCGAVGVHWMMFGSSGKQEWEDAPVIERFTWRPNESLPYNRMYKSIVRLDDAALSTLGSEHHFQTSGGTINEDGTPLLDREAPPRSSILRLNHYFTKSRKEWEQRHPIDTSGETWGRDENRWLWVQAMDVDDRTIQRFLAALKERLK